MDIKIISILLLLLVGGKSFAQKMTIVGYCETNNCRVVLSTTRSDGTIESIASDTVINSKFTIKVNVSKTPSIGILSVIGSATPIVIEPGEVKARITYGEGNIITGGHYNKIMFACDATSEMKQLHGKIKTLDKSYDFSKISDGERKLYMKSMRELRTSIGKLSKDYLLSLYNHKDAYVRLFALSLNFDVSDSAVELLAIIEAEIGVNQSVKMLQDLRLQSVKAARAKLLYVVGGNIYNFTSQDVDGKNYQLSDIYSKNQYTLVEFWASWCAPCVAEGKKLVPVYEKYHSNNFEIFAYSIDEVRDRWIDKSVQLAIKWINTHSDKATRNDVQSELSITTIPRNYLVDSKGVIIAIDINSEELAEFLDNHISL